MQAVEQADVGQVEQRPGDDDPEQREAHRPADDRLPEEQQAAQAQDRGHLGEQAQEALVEAEAIDRPVAVALADIRCRPEQEDHDRGHGDATRDADTLEQQRNQRHGDGEHDFLVERNVEHLEDDAEGGIAEAHQHHHAGLAASERPAVTRRRRRGDARRAPSGASKRNAQHDEDG